MRRKMMVKLRVLVLCLVGLVGWSHIIPTLAFVPSQERVVVRSDNLKKKYNPQIQSSSFLERQFGGVVNSNTYHKSTKNDLEVSTKSEEEQQEYLIDGRSSIELLNDAIGYDVSAANILISELSKMRDNNNPTSREDVNDFLNYLLMNGPDSSSIPVWAKLLPIAKFSKRVRMIVLRRTLDKTTPPPSDSEDSKNDDNNGSKKKDQEFVIQRRRRALVTLLRSIANTNDENNDDNDGVVGSSKKKKIPAIVILSRKAKQEMKKNDSNDLKNRLPEGLETPKYEVLAQRGAAQANIEIRKYEPFSICSVSMTKPRPTDSAKTDAKVQMPEMNGASSFGALAGYLFGKNDQSTPMKMTTPVITTPNSETDDKQMAFVLPSEFWMDNTLKTAPQPLVDSGVELKQRGSEERAVIMFGGYASKKEIKKRKKELMNALGKDREWKAATEDAEVSQYNDPFTAPWKRLNEVSVSIVSKK